MNTVPTPQPSITPARRAAIRGMILDSVDAAVAAAPADRRRRTVVRFASIAAAAVLVVGGGGLAYATLHGSSSQTQPPVAVRPPVSSAPAPSPQPTSTAGPTGSPGGIVDPAGTASPAPTTPSIDLGDPSSWVITTAGIGPLTLGGSQKSEALSTTGAYDVTAPGYACPVNFYTPKTASDPKLVTEAFKADSIDLIMIGELGTPPAADSPKTPSGIGLGSTQAELLTTYPHIESLSTSVGDAGTFGETYGIRDSEGRWLTFVLDDQGQVGEIDISFTEGKSGEFC